MQRGVSALAPGEEAPLVGHDAGCRGNGQEGGDSCDLEEAAHRRQVPLPEGGDEGHSGNFLSGGGGHECELRSSRFSLPDNLKKVCLTTH